MSEVVQQSCTPVSSMPLEDLEIPACPWLVSVAAAPAVLPVLRQIGGVLEPSAAILLESKSTKEQRKAAFSTLADYLGYESPVVRNYLLRCFKLFPQESSLILRERLNSGLAPEAAECALLCIGVLGHNSSDKPEFAEDVAPFLSAADTRVRVAARKACSFISSEVSCRLLLESLKTWLSDEKECFQILEALSESRRTDLVPDILTTLAQAEWWNTSGSPLPPKLHLLSSSGWLARHLEQLPVLLWCERLGIIDKAVCDRLIDTAQEQEREAAGVLLANFGLVSTAMFEQYCAAIPSERTELLASWHKRCVVLSKLEQKEERVLTQLSSARVGPRAVDRDLALAVLRDPDFDLLTAPEEPAPFDRTRQDVIKFERCFYLAPREFLSWLEERETWHAQKVFGAETSEELQNLLMPYALSELLAARSDCRRYESAEQELKSYSRFAALARMMCVSDGVLSFKPEFQDCVEREAGIALEHGCNIEDEDAIAALISELTSPKADSLLRYGVMDVKAEDGALELLKDVDETPEWKSLCPGAQSIVHLMAYEAVLHKGKEEAAEVLRVALQQIATAEANAKDVEPTAGVEVQSPNVGTALVFAWKQLLSRFGVPSPRRIEFGKTMECAFLPVRSLETVALAIPALHRLGLHKDYKAASALHVSIAGDLGAEIKYIMIPLRYYRFKEKNTEDGKHSVSTTMLFSKGYAFRNGACQSVAPGESVPIVRTEMRATVLQNKPDSPELFSKFEEFLPAVQLLATALLAYSKPVTEGPLSELEEELAKIWSDYRTRVEAICREERFNAGSLLAVDWYESTGAHRDLFLMNKLEGIPILENLASQFSENLGLYREFQNALRTAFVSSADQVGAAIKKASA